MPTYDFRGEIRRVCTVRIQAATPEEALQRAQAGDWDDYEETNVEEVVIFHDDELPEESDADDAQKEDDA